MIKFKSTFIKVYVLLIVIHVIRLLFFSESLSNFLWGVIPMIFMIFSLIVSIKEKQ